MSFPFSFCALMCLGCAWDWLQVWASCSHERICGCERHYKGKMREALSIKGVCGELLAFTGCGQCL